MPVTVSLLEGNAFVSETHPDPFFGRFFIWPISFIILFPAVTYFLRQFNIRIGEALDAASNEGILANSKTKERAYALKKMISSRYKHITIGVITAIYGYYFAINILEVPIMASWPFGNVFGFSYLFWVSVLIWLVNAFVLLNFVVDLVIWIRLGFVLASGYKDGEFSPMPYHPDNAAGLSLFGSVSVSIYKIFIILVLFVCLNTYMSILLYPEYSIAKIATYSVGILSSFIAAIITLPLSFIMPMLPLRNLLIRIRREKLKQIRIGIKKLHDNIYENDSSNEAIKESLERLKLMDNLYQKILKIPAWPFNGRVVKVYITSTLTPAFIFIIDLLFKLRGME